MATVNNNVPATNQQLNGIVNVASMPLASPRPLNSTSMIIGGVDESGFSLALAGTPANSALTAPQANTTGGGQIVVGGGTTPGVGAQPPAPTSAANGLPPSSAALVAASPTATTPAASTTTTPAAAAATTTTATTPAADGDLVEAQGFGRTDKNAEQRVSTGGAAFSFPSFNASAKSNTAPDIKWDSSWKRVEKDGMWYMEAPNGVKAIPAVEYRVTPSPASKVKTVKVANGWGKKFPDGTIVVFDRKEGAYRLDPKGNKHPLPLGMHKFGGVKVRVFEASVVRTLQPDGKVEVFDSRGTASRGTTRGRVAAALGAADAGASISGGGKTTGAGPTDGSGVKAGGTATLPLTQNIQQLTEIARGLLDQVRSGTIDAAKLASLQSQLGALPAGLLQAMGAAGAMTSAGILTPATTTPATTTTPANTQVAGVNGPGVASGGGANATSPVAGANANATTKDVAEGTKFELGEAMPKSLGGKIARFAQLPDEVQQAIAKALGSDQGAGALKADQPIAFSMTGQFSLVGGGTVYMKHQAQIRGAGPGEELALTVRPGRQPGSPRPTATASSIGTTRPVSGGGANASNAKPAVTPPITTTPTTAPITGGGAAKRTTIKLFEPGAELRDIRLGGINGTFTWATLPAKAKEAVLDFLRTQKSDPSAKAYASRTGSGWSFDPKATITVAAGFANFVNGLDMSRGGGAAPAPSGVTGGGPTSTPVGHDANRPPVSGGGASAPGGATAPGAPSGAARPNVAPPIPAIADPGEAPAGGVAGAHNH